MFTKNSNTRLRWMAVCAILLIATLLAACGAPAAEPTATPNPPTTTPPTDTPVPPIDSKTVVEIEAMVEEMMAEHHIPGLAIGIVKDGELAFAKGFGVTNVESGEPVTPKTVFPLAEIAMVPTAIAILQLVEAGKIDLDAPITDYLPYFEMAVGSYKDMTVRHLMNHRSGIRQIGQGAMAEWSTLEPEFDEDALERWVRSLADEGLLFAPDQGFEHTNRGYALLGDVIAKASGQSYEAYVQDNIFTPLRMHDTTSLLNEVDSTTLASSHVEYGRGNMIVSENIPYHRPFAGGNNLFSNIEDMAKLAQNSLSKGSSNGKRILSESSYTSMWEAHSQTPFGDHPFGNAYSSKLMQKWGYGGFIGEIEGHTAYHGGGQEEGLLHIMLVVPDEQLAVITMGNAPVLGAYYSMDIATDVMGILLNE